jgi:hypothetical protein
MKQKIEIILEETGYKESRAAKMDLNDILKYVRLPSPHEFADGGFVDYCRPFMTLISISLECAIIWQYPPPVSTIIYLAQLSYILCSCFPHHSMDGQETGFSSCSNPRLLVRWSISMTMFLSEGYISTWQVRVMFIIEHLYDEFAQGTDNRCPNLCCPRSDLCARSRGTVPSTSSVLPQTRPSWRRIVIESRLFSSFQSGRGTLVKILLGSCLYYSDPSPS